MTESMKLWCSVAPRGQYASLNRSRVLKRIDDTPVWSIVCFFIAKPHRGLRTSEKLIAAAIDYVRNQGGKVVEAAERACTEKGVTFSSVHANAEGTRETLKHVQDQIIAVLAQ